MLLKKKTRIAVLKKWHMAGLSMLQSGPKGTKMVNLNVFGHLGPILGPSGPFWTILDKNDFFAPNGQSRVWQRCLGAKNEFLFAKNGQTSMNL